MWLSIWLPIGLYAQDDTSVSYDHAKDAAYKAVEALNRCTAALVACTAPCATAADTPACVARCPDCRMAEQSAKLAADLQRRLATSPMKLESPPAPPPPPPLPASDTIKTAIGAAMNPLGSLANKTADFTDNAVYNNPDAVAKFLIKAAITAAVVGGALPATSGFLMAAGVDLAYVGIEGGSMNDVYGKAVGTSILPFSDEAADFAELFFDAKELLKEPGVAVFAAPSNPPPTRIWEPIKPMGQAVFSSTEPAGIATFQAATGAGTAVFSTQPKRPSWSGDGIAVFTPLTPIPEVEITDQPAENEPATRPSTSFWRSLLIGVLQQTPAITQAIWGPKQPVVLPQPQAKVGQAAVRPAVTPAAKNTSPSGLTVPSVSMCLNPAALAITHSTTQNGPYVTSPNAPDSYNALYIPCSQVKK